MQRRVVVTAQIVFVTFVLLMSLLVFASDIAVASEVFFSWGVALAVLTTLLLAVALRFSGGSLWLAAIPLCDTVSIGFLHLGLPTLMAGALWVFPVLWIAASLSVIYLVAAVIIAVVFSALCVVMAGDFMPGQLVPALIILPLVLAFVGVMTQLGRRHLEQQRSRERQQESALRSALNRAQANELLLAEILDAVDFGVVRLNSAGEITMSNRAFAEFEQVIGCAHVYDADGLNRIDDAHTPLARAAVGETFTEQLVWCGLPEQGRRALATSSDVITGDTPGEFDRLLVMRDVTTQLAAIRARDDLVSSVSHELRTPMTSVLGYIDLALEGDMDPRARNYLSVAERNGHRLLELISHILESTRSDVVDIELSPETVNLETIVEATVEAQAPLAHERGIRIDATSIRPISLVLDRSRIRQVVDNILSNAIKYNSDRGCVTIHLDECDEGVALRVSDNGQGVPPHEAARVFERHFRSESARNSAVSGNGLGLAISRDIVRKHGGELTFESTPGEGTVVTMVLPKLR